MPCVYVTICDAHWVHLRFFLFLCLGYLQFLLCEQLIPYLLVIAHGRSEQIHLASIQKWFPLVLEFEIIQPSPLQDHSLNG
jgi:hypothetical protein